MIKVFMVGNLTRDVETATTNSGISIARFTVASARQYSNADGERVTDFFDVTTFRGLADNCAKFLHKGDKVALTGEGQIDTYEDKDGNKRKAFKIVAENVEFCTLKRAEETQEQPKKKLADLKPTDDDFPF